MWANNDIIDYPLCSIEKTKNEQKKTETKSVNYLKIELNGNLQHIYNITIIESNHICIFFGHHLKYWTSMKLLPNETQEFSLDITNLLDIFTTSTGILLEQHKMQMFDLTSKLRSFARIIK